MINYLVSNFFSNLNKKKIKYAILRNYESMPNRPRNRNYFDLDLIVSSKDLKKFHNLLIKNILKDNKAILIKTFKRSYVHHYRIAKINGNKFDSIQIDVHVKGQGWWGFYYLFEDEILNKRRLFKRFYVVSDFHRNLFNWLDKLLWGELKKEYSKPIKKSMSKNISNLRNFLTKINLSKDDIKKLINIFSSKTLKTENTIYFRSKILFKIIRWSSLKHPFETIKWSTEFFFRELYLRIFPPGLFIICNKSIKKNIYLFNLLKRTAIMGQTSLILNFHNISKIKYIYYYFKFVWPIVRHHGLVVCVSNNNFFGVKKIKRKKLSKSNLIKKILIEYKKTNYVGFPNLIIN